MKQTVLFSLLLYFSTFSVGLAQITIDSNGKVSVGTTTVYTSIALDARYLSGPSALTRSGVRARAENGRHTWGVYATAVGDGGSNGNAWGVYGTASNATNIYAGYFSGDLAYTGDLIDVSDANLKEGVISLAQADVVAKLMQLQPRSYSYIQDVKYAPMNLAPGTHFGLVAQEVEQVFPELVSDNVHPGALAEDGETLGEPITYKGIDYVEMIPLLLQAVQEQQQRIEFLEARISALESR